MKHIQEKDKIWGENIILDEVKLNPYKYYTELESIKNKERYIKTIERNSKQQLKKKEYRVKNKIKIKDKNLKRAYGISIEEYNKLFGLQKGCCAICGKSQNDFDYFLNIDHDHITGRVRGLLCRDCNQALGHLHDNVELLNKAIEYLNKNNF